MPMLWMRMPGETWPGAAASFVGMWMSMMLPMMLPSVVPVLWRHRMHFGRRIGLVAAGYFGVWGVVGVLVYPVGVALASAQMRFAAFGRVVPFAAAAVVSIAGAWQFTRWKAHSLACCRQALERQHGVSRADADSAWRHGLHLGLRCVSCCGNMMAILLVLGAMDVRAMVVVACAIALERLAPAGERVARVTGVVAMAGGMLLLARSAGFLSTPALLFLMR